MCPIRADPTSKRKLSHRLVQSRLNSLLQSRISTRILPKAARIKSRWALRLYTEALGKFERAESLAVAGVDEKAQEYIEKCREAVSNLGYDI
mmetsp:Transcript_2881/g.5393  ORF Transcript_2881/g.5393 Transcript_2881/m.5393 type:complete len:92 (-) Transcript_2881:183-458(-)